MKRKMVSLAVMFFASVFVSFVDASAQSKELVPSEEIRVFPVYLGFSFKISEAAELGDFGSIDSIRMGYSDGENWYNAKLRPDGKLALTGEIRRVDGTTFKFRAATLERDGGVFFKKFSVLSESVKGWHYEFKGIFYDQLQRRGSVYVDLRGELTLYHNHKVTAVKTFEFSNTAIE